MEFKHFIIYFFEWAAFIFSIYYYKKQPSKPIKHFIIFLGFTIIVETIGFYTFFVEEGDFLSFLKDTSFEKNYWLYNVFFIIGFLFYTSFFKWFLRNTKTIKLMEVLSGIFLIISISILVFSDVLFNKYPAITLISGTVLVLISIFTYYLELINSDRILNVTNQFVTQTQI